MQSIVLVYSMYRAATLNRLTLITAYICLWFSMMKNAFWMWFTGGQESFLTECTGGHNKLTAYSLQGPIVGCYFIFKPHISSSINLFLHVAAVSGWLLALTRISRHIDTSQRRCSVIMPFKMCLSSVFFFLS